MRTSIPSERSPSSSYWQRWRWRKQRRHIAGEYINSKAGKKRIKKEWKYREKKDELHTFKDNTTAPKLPV
ncbi:hypothetical protein [Prevotella intermedia]|uniref:hypothetical protein n=1 Tax=Prevotella intermedia TaxID=28131 RepID=UPI001EE3F1B5|nr:hypothetical protein [Prevotella intermedia]